MQKLLAILLLTLSIPAYAIPGEVWCWSEQKMIFHKKADKIFYDKDCLVAETKIFTYVIFNTDCIIKYKHKDLPKKH